MKHFVWTVLVVVCICTVVAADHIVQQVEDFDGTWKRQTNIRGFMGKGFCTSNANPDLAETPMTQKVNIQQGGNHSVWVRAYTSSNSDRACQVQVNDKKLAKTHTSSERRWSWEKAGEVDLETGEAIIRVWDAADGFESVDAVMLTDQADLDPAAAEKAERQWLVYGGKVPDEANAIQFVINKCCTALQHHTPPTSKSEWDKRAPEVRNDLAQALGLDPMPERTPLNAQVTGKADRDSYRIENIVIESRPHFYVPGNLYIPKDITLPAPGVVVTMGHAMEDGKNYGLYQEAQLGLVRQGFVVLGIDPIGQGERKLPGFDHPLGYGSLLVGRTNEGYIVWDTLRALDYLAARPEVNPEKIGLCGNSGGGECTFYTMPFDERFQAGASFCFVCSYEAFFRDGGNHCICNHLPGIVHKMEEFEIIGLNVPRPFLQGNGIKDKIFPIEGVRLTHERAKQIYDLYDAAACKGAAEVDLGHGWSPGLREACYGWMAHWLQDRGDGSPLAEPELTPEEPKCPDVLCFKDGMPENAETMVSLNQQRAEALQKNYPAMPGNKAEWDALSTQLRSAFWEVLGGKPDDFAPEAKVLNKFSWEDCEVETISLAVEAEMDVACLWVQSKRVKPESALIYVCDKGKDNLRHDPEVLNYLKSGMAVLGLDPRGSGETAVHENHVTSDGICLGRPLFAQRVWDVMQAARYASKRSGVQVLFNGTGALGLLGVFAQGLGNNFSAVTVQDCLASFRYFIEDSQPQPISLCVPGILEVGDITHVAALCAPEPLNLIGLVGYGKTALDEQALTQEFALVRSVYGIYGEGKALNTTLKF